MISRFFFFFAGIRKSLVVRREPFRPIVSVTCPSKTTNKQSGGTETAMAQEQAALLYVLSESDAAPVVAKQWN